MFQKYRRVGFCEARPFVDGEVLPSNVSISEADQKGGSPVVGDMIAHNPINHKDQWLINKDYFAANYQLISGD